MKTSTPPIQTEADVWLRILCPRGMSAASARMILGLKVPPEERKRLRELSAKARSGTLSAAEEREMDAFERAGETLAILQAHARGALKDKRLSR